MSLPASFTTVTPFSKLLALVLFITLPLIAFYFGTSYGKSVNITSSLPNTCPRLASGVSTCVAQSKCSDEAKQCPDGSYVFRGKPQCTFAACPSLKSDNKAPLPTNIAKKGTLKQTQIATMLSQKTGIPGLNLIITYTNDQQNTQNVKEDTIAYDGGTYSNRDDSIKGRWIAAKINGNWNVTSLSSGIPKCSDVNPYYYPKTLVPACKDTQGNITAR